MEVALLASALLVGCLLAVQAAVNQQLNKAVGTPYGASTLQLSVAAAALAAVALAAGALGAARQVTEVEHWWLLAGGVASPIYITAGILLFPRLGALNTVGLFVTGQVFASMALDLFGILAVPQQAVGPGLLLGAAAVLAGITVTIRGLRTGAVATVQRAARPGWLALGVLAGAVLPFQGAINAQLKRDIGEPLAVGTISFVVATLTIALVLLVLVLVRRTPAPRVAPLRGMPWWGWLGGLCAATYVTATFLLLPRIGAAVTVALTVTGQQLASALIDQYGWFRMPQRATTGPRMLGLGLLVAGSALVQLA
jgi:bacterial/archaeal transporter family-2 protein